MPTQNQTTPKGSGTPEASQEPLAKAQRDANGWRPVIEFPNGGRQVFVCRYGTMDEAVRQAQKGVRLRKLYPASVVRDPLRNERQDLADAKVDPASEVLRRIAYPRRGTSEESASLQDFANLIQSAWTLDELETVDRTAIAAAQEAR